MRSELSNRHRGDLGGRLSGGRALARVVVRVGQGAATTPAGQHLAWMLVNLLARQDDEIREIELDVPDGVEPVGRLSPLVPPGSDLKESLARGVEEVNPGVLVPKRGSRTRVSVLVGPGELEDANFSVAVSAVGWSGYVGRLPAEIIGDDPNPIGPYVAACLGAGEVFKHVRAVRPDAGGFVERMWLDAYEMRVREEPAPGPRLPTQLHSPAAALAGVGAVGSAFLHALYPIQGLKADLTLVDNDPEGIDHTNLNRYAIFGRAHGEGRYLKASTAATLMEGSGVNARPVDDSWQAWRAEDPGRPLGLVISAVDRNKARHAVQDALPRLILGAATNEMRAQVNLYDVLGGGPCLRCRNRPEEEVPDQAIIDRLRNLGPAEREAEARRVGVDPTNLETFLEDPRRNCGLVGGATLQKFSGGSDEVEWAVGFVSVLAGVLLAAEYLKLGLDPNRTALDATRNTFRFQFWRPDKASANKVVSTPPESGCLCGIGAFRRALESLQD
ncbi:MAG: ThiF family adenylyltransferase [Actinomycetota bacterium]|nr:ThiF family adenylyltransferase [Actinomycetota bacterium]